MKKNEKMVRGKGISRLLTGVRLLGHVLNTLILSNEDSGTVTLEEFMNAVPGDGVDSTTAIQFLRNNGKGTFIEGRRGHPSRFVFGQALADWQHSMEIRRGWRIRNGRNPETGTPVRPVAGRGRGRPPGSTNKPKVVELEGKRYQLVPA